MVNSQVNFCHKLFTIVPSTRLYPFYYQLLNIFLRRPRISLMRILSHEISSLKTALLQISLFLRKRNRHTRRVFRYGTSTDVISHVAKKYMSVDPLRQKKRQNKTKCKKHNLRCGQKINHNKHARNSKYKRIILI